MIIVDFNQVFIASIMVQSNNTRVSIDKDSVRHMVLKSLRSYRQKFGKTYGEMVIACDAKNLWRKDYFPFYKARRKKDQQESYIDWGAVYKILDELRIEFADNLPYKFLHVDRCEADDVIASLVEHCENKEDGIGLGEPCLIISKDKDFIQLHSASTKQYNPIDKVMMTGQNPFVYLHNHICKGDRGDGIPNVLSPDNVFVSGGRQKPLRETAIVKLSDENSDIWTSEVTRNWQRNNVLINLMYIPRDLKEKIVREYKDALPSTRSALPAYFMKHKLKDLASAISEF